MLATASFQRFSCPTAIPILLCEDSPRRGCVHATRIKTYAAVPLNCNLIMDSELLSELVTNCTAAGELNLRARLRECLDTVASDPTPSLHVCAALLEFSKRQPAIFKDAEFLQLLLAMLDPPLDKRRAQNMGLGGDKSSVPRPVQELAAGILFEAYKLDRDWPPALLNAYMIDALGARLWIEHPACKSFTDNLRTAWKPVAAVQQSAAVMRPRSASFTTVGAAAAVPPAPLSRRSSCEPSGSDEDSSSGEEMDVEDGNAVVLAAGTVALPGHRRSSVSPAAAAAAVIAPVAVPAAAAPLAAALVANRFTGQAAVAAHRLIVSHLVTRLHAQGLETGELSVFVAAAGAGASSGAANNTTWQVVLALTELCCLPAARTLAALNLGKWLQSAALSSHAAALLLALTAALLPGSATAAADYTAQQRQEQTDLAAADAVFALQVKPSQVGLHAEAVTRLLRRRPVLARRALRCALWPPAELQTSSSSSSGSSASSSDVLAAAAVPLQPESARLITAVCTTRGSEATADLAAVLVARAAEQALEASSSSSSSSGSSSSTGSSSSGRETAAAAAAVTLLAAQGSASGCSALNSLLRVLALLGYAPDSAVEARSLVRALLSEAAAAVAAVAPEAGGRMARRRFVRIVVALVRAALGLRAGPLQVRT
jgi:hypothetical protein